MLQQTSKVHEIIIGYGTFGSEVGIADRFGLPTGIKSGGIGLDIPMTKTVVADNNNQENFKNYRLQAGMIASSLEHQTPEQMYNTDPSNPVQGISTMKAFALANAQGQKIYTITQANINEVLPKIQASSSTKGDIIGSVNAGKTVTVHEREVSVTSWSGTGYMVIDPNNSDGAYLISGGGNGGFAEIAERIIIPIYALLDLMWNNLDEVGALFWGTIVGKIADLLDNIQDVYGVFEACGAMQGIVAIVVLWMLVTLLTTMLILAITLGGIAGFILGGLLTYGFAQLFNMVTDGMKGKCK